MLLEAKQQIAEMCTELNVLMSDVMSRKRTGVKIERAIIVTLIKENHPEMSLESVGQLFGKKANGSAHSFVLFCVKKTNSLFHDKAFREKFFRARRAIDFVNEYNHIPQY